MYEKQTKKKKNSEVPQYDMLNITTVLFKLKPEQNTKYLLIFSFAVAGKQAQTQSAGFNAA